MVSGIGLDAYWLSSYLWDAGSNVLLVGFTLVVLAASDVKALMNGEAAGATVLLFFMYSISMVGLLVVFGRIRSIVEPLTSSQVWPEGMI